MTNSRCEESDGVRKVRLKTTSGVLTLCYRSSQSLREADNNSPDASSVAKVSQGGSQVSGVSEESSFGSLPELFGFSDQFAIREGSDEYGNSLLDLRPDFSTYKFWASESGSNLPLAVDLSDTFSRCDLAGLIDHSAPGLDPIVDDSHFPDGLQNCATKPDSHFQNTAKSSTIGEVNMNRKSFWDFPLELEENIFECANYWNSLKEVTDQKDIHGEIAVDDFLVDLTPELCDVVANAENSDSNLLVYAPNRYLEDACIFQSPPAYFESDIEIETLRTNGGHRIHDSHKVSRRKRRTIREDCVKDEQSLDLKSRNPNTTASCIEESNAKHSLSESTEDKGRVQRLYDFVNDRRRRFSTFRAKRSKFSNRTTLTSSDERSPNQGSREIKRGRRVTRSPIGKSESARPIFKAASSSHSPSAGESDHNYHKSPHGTTPDQPSVSFAHRKAHVGYSAETSQGQSASSPLKDILNQSSSRGAPTWKVSPVKNILNKSFHRDIPTLKLSSNPCLLRKKRSRYADVLLSPDDSTKIGTRFNKESLSQDSPKKSQSSKASTPRDSPAIAEFQSPQVSRKKGRTCRRRPLQGLPSSAKKLHFYGKIIYESSSQVVQRKPSPEREGKSEKKSAERRGRRRLPLPASSVEILQGWLNENSADPYPSRQEKDDLLFQTDLKMSQIDNWLGNARQKLKLKSRAVKDLCSESAFLSERLKSNRRGIARVL